MTGQVIHTEKSHDVTVVVIEEADGFALVARYGRREGTIAHREDKRAAKSLARSVAAVAALDGFPQWLASGEAMGKAF